MTSSGTPPLAVRTLEVLWHGCERDEEAVRRGLQGVAIEGIVSIDYCSRGHRIVTCGGDGHIRLWRLHPAATDAWLSNGQSDMTACVSYITGMRTSWTPLTARWSPHGGMIASAHCDGKICLWWQERSGNSGNRNSKGSGHGNDDDSDSDDDVDDMAAWKDYRHLSGHVMDVYDICFSPDARYLLSAGGDGSIVIHDLGGNNTPNTTTTTNSSNNGSTVPVVQLQEVHRSFCRGVAWDPWRRGVASFGGSPALLFFTHVPSTPARRTHLAAQRRAAGDYIGDSCATTFRRFGWSPDGSLVAVPYGKATQSHSTTTTTTTTTTATTTNNNNNNNNSSSGGSINKQGNTNDQNHHGSTGGSSGMDTGSGMTADANGDGSVNNTCEARKADDMIHCVYLYTRNVPEKVAGRLIVRGYSEIRGVLWAPCFLEPLKDKDHYNTNEEEMEMKEEAIVRKQQVSLRERGSWGPDDYRMAMAVWTADAVVIYTTDSAVRHSDYTDLHMRSISDVAWSPHAKYLLTASLDGYVSIISTGGSLGIAHKLPIFSTKPVTVALCRMLAEIHHIGEKVELGRKLPSTDATVAKSVGKSAGTTAVVVHAPVKKKKKVEEPQEEETEKPELKQPVELVQLSELSELMEGT